MKVVVSCGSKNWGGLELMAELLALGLRRRGDKVVLFCRRGSPLHRKLEGSLPCEPILGGSDAHPVTHWRAWRALGRHRPDVILANTVKEPRWVGAAAKLRGIPFVYRQEIDEPYRRGPYHRLVYGAVPDVHVVNSEATRRTILRSAPWLPPERVVLIPNGVDLARLHQAPTVSLGLPPGAVVFGFVGRWEDRKGIRELAEAWHRVAAAVPEAHLAIAGWGEAEPRFRGWLEGAPRVHWPSFREDVPSVMKAVDVLVAPSHYEGFGLVLVEAMGVGTPVIATLASSIPEIVTDGVEGRLVPARDPTALAGEMIALARDPAARARMGEAGRERVARDFDVELMLDRHQALLRGLL